MKRSSARRDWDRMRYADVSSQRLGELVDKFSRRKYPSDVNAPPAVFPLTASLDRLRKKEAFMWIL